MRSAPTRPMVTGTAPRIRGRTYFLGGSTSVVTSFPPELGTARVSCRGLAAGRIRQKLVDTKSNLFKLRRVLPVLLRHPPNGDPDRRHNFCRVHKTLGTTPAVAAGVADRVWKIEDIVALLEAAEATPIRRGRYSKTRAREQNSD